MEKENYKVMNKEDAESYKKWAKEKINHWHDIVNPDYVILNETSATPLGWLLRETWRNAFPSEKVPKFLRIDPRLIHTRKYYKDMNQTVRTYPGQIMERKIKDKNAQIIVYDELRSSNDGKALINYIKNGKHCSSRPYHSDSERNVINMLQEAGFKDVLGDFGMPRSYTRDLQKKYSKPTMKFLGLSRHYGFNMAKEKGLINEKEYAKLGEFFKNGKSMYLEKAEKRGYTAQTIKQPAVRRDALNFIHDLKFAGKEAGEELKQEQTQKKILENIISGFLITGFIGAIIYLFSLQSSLITGNVVANNIITNKPLFGSIISGLVLLTIFLGFRIWRKVK